MMCIGTGYIYIIVSQFSSFDLFRHISRGQVQHALRRLLFAPKFIFIYAVVYTYIYIFNSRVRVFCFGYRRVRVRILFGTPCRR